MKAIVYVLSALTSLICMFMLLKGYIQTNVKFLLWSGICFGGLTLNNVLLYIDRQIYPDVDLSMWRQLPALVGLMFLLYGLIWDASFKR